MNFDSGLPKTFLRTLFADNSPLIFKVACAWSGFQTNVLPENPLLARHPPKQLLLGQGGAEGGEEPSNTLCPEREG